MNGMNHRSRSAYKGLLFVMAVIVLMMTLITHAFSQENEKPSPDTFNNIPAIDKPCPAFTLPRAQRFLKKNVTLASLSGKWNILNFWVSTCAGCIHDTPQLDQWYTKYKSQLSVITIVKDDSATRKVWNKLNTRRKLTMPYVYDSTLSKAWGIRYYPHYLVIDPKGVVRAITHQLTEQHILEMLNENKINLPVKPNRWQIMQQHPVEWNKPLLIDGNGGEETDFLYRSLLVRWRKEMGYINYTHLQQSTIFNNSIQLVGLSLSQLYQMAYQDTISPKPRFYDFETETAWDRQWRQPLVEVNDASLFEVDYNNEKGLYAYSIQVPPERKMSARDFQLLMRRDLLNYYGYDVRVEHRLMPYYKLKTTSEKARQSLRTKGGIPMMEAPQDKLVMVNMPVYKLINIIWFSDQFGPPIIDETGIEGNIDLSIDAFISERPDIIRALREKGLFLEKGEKEMSVIVISDTPKG